MDANPPRHSFRLSDLLGLIAIAAFGVWLGAALRPAPATNSVVPGEGGTKAATSASVATSRPTAASGGDTMARDDAKLSSLLPTSAASAAKSTALPPPNQPIAQTYAELAPRARAGDAKAARRLAEDLRQCAPSVQTIAKVTAGSDPLADLSAEERARFEAMKQRQQAEKPDCDGLSRAQALEAADWLRQAALNGDAEAMLCSVMSPFDFRQIDALSPDWRRYAQRWREEAPGMAERALFAGMPEAANLLAAMNAPLGDFSLDATRGLLGDHPDRAYLYARIYLDHAAGFRQQGAQATLNRYGERLDAATRAALDAQARALESRIAFAPAFDRTDRSPDRAYCTRLRLVTGAP